MASSNRPSRRPQLWWGTVTREPAQGSFPTALAHSVVEVRQESDAWPQLLLPGVVRALVYTGGPRNMLDNPEDGQCRVSAPAPGKASCFQLMGHITFVIERPRYSSAVTQFPESRKAFFIKG